MNDTGKQKPTRIDSTPKMNKNRSSTMVHEKILISISNAPVKQAMMPMIARAANDMTPVLVIFCSMFCGIIVFLCVVIFVLYLMLHLTILLSVHDDHVGLLFPDRLLPTIHEPINSSDFF